MPALTRSIFFAATLALLAITLSHPDLWLTALLCALVLMVGFAYLDRDSSISPFAVYLWIVVAVVAGIIAVRVLQILGPLPLLVFIPIAIVVLLVTHFRRRTRHRERLALAGHCDHCGYDLRASHDVCPECGHPIPEELARRRRFTQELRRTARAAPPASNPNP